MQKDNFFTQTWFEPKIHYPKNCVNYNKSNLQQISVKGPKDPNSAKKMPKSNIKFQNVPKNATKKREMVPLPTFPRYSVKFCKDITPDRIFFTPTLLAHLYVFASLLLSLLGDYVISVTVEVFLLLHILHFLWRKYFKSSKIQQQ